MSELVCLELSILLWYAHVLTQGAFAGAALGLPYLSGPGTTGVNPKDSYFRAPRALGNYVENPAPFVAECR